MVEIEFVSGDQDENAYNGYYKTMPWESRGYNKDGYKKLMDTYGLRGIPALILLAEDGETAVSKDARGHVTSKGLGAYTHWAELVQAHEDDKAKKPKTEQ